MTQLESARQGTITPEMHYVAQREDLDPELIRSEVARGRMVIPANIIHLQRSSSRWPSAWRRKCKINANIGNSAVTGKVEDELEKLHTAVHLGSDTVMDLSTGGNIDGIRQAIIDASPVPIGTVPIYQAIQQVKEPTDLTPQQMLDMVEHQAKQGVDYMTIHAGVLIEYVPLTTQSRDGHRQPRRLADGGVDDRPSPTESVVHALRRVVRDHARLRRDVLPGRRPAARLACRRERRSSVCGVEDARRIDAERPGSTAAR